MTTIGEISRKYCGQIDFLDLELLIAHELKKTREFVLAHPEHQLNKRQELKIKDLIARRAKHEPLAYILDHKEFFGLDFKVNKHTLVPRPVTELLVEQTLQTTQESGIRNQELCIFDVGTGSGNIIISLAKNIHVKNSLFAIDSSAEALKVARQNAKRHKVEKNIKFLHGNLLDPLAKTTNHKLPATNLMIIANLPYLSKEIYAATKPTVKRYEPKSALYSPDEGLAHYKKLLKQINLLTTDYGLQVTFFLEISPEQKPKITKLIKSFFPAAKTVFFRDLTGKWRACKLEILSS